MREVVIIGAGKIGRGYMGQIFYENGYSITFVDILPALIEEINEKGTYQIHEVDTGVDDIYEIKDIQALHARAVDAICEKIAQVTIVVTSVGAGNLTDVAANIAAAIRYRKEKSIESSLNILVAENLMNGAQKFTTMIQQHLDDAEVDFMQHYVGIVGTVIGRTVPPLPTALETHSITDVFVEPHREFYINKYDYRGEIPNINGIHVTERYLATVSRKLYVHNCTHAVMGYLGHYYGHQFSHEAMADERVSSVVGQAMEETALAVEKEFGFSREEMQKYIQDLFHRYKNPHLGDTLLRIAKDPIRKLQPDDRLIGSARLIEKGGDDPQALAIGIAAALCFDVESDEKSQMLQHQILQDGIEVILERIAGIAVDERLGNEVLMQYHRLRQR